ncbi:hypothetical protein GF386_01210 [Candidatus Pacearchaeota archaeon]|nr:hypothetical protein [Candidatus Pacearchaeota archaeon]
MVKKEASNKKNFKEILKLDKEKLEELRKEIKLNREDLKKLKNKINNQKSKKESKKKTSGEKDKTVKKKYKFNIKNNFNILILSLIIFLCFVLVVLSLFYLNYLYPPELEDCKNLGGEEKQMCVIDKAILYRDSSLCRVIKDMKKKISCIQNVEKKQRICEVLTGSNRADCFLALAKATNDESFCEKINKTSYQSWRNRCFSEIAVNKKDHEICRRIYVYDKEGKLNSCDTIELENICRKDVAVARGDLKYCEENLEGVSRDFCIFGVAKTRKNHQVCFTIKDNTIKANCFIYFAKLNSDIIICDEIWDEDKKIGCVEVVKNLK